MAKKEHRKEGRRIRKARKVERKGGKKEGPYLSGVGIFVAERVHIVCSLQGRTGRTGGNIKRKEGRGGNVRK